GRVRHGCHGEGSEFDTVRGWVLREAVTNVVRHAQAHTCCVEIDDEILVISDNGRGRGGAPEGNGLTGMRRRVEAAGGRVVDRAGGAWPRYPDCRDRLRP
ncbi:sensor histidine kinase, two-component system, partial [Cutibacterium acnes FZ1/2/0]